MKDPTIEDQLHSSWSARGRTTEHYKSQTTKLGWIKFCDSLTSLELVTITDSTSCNCKRLRWRVAQAPGSGWDITVGAVCEQVQDLFWTYATAEPLLPVASSVLLQLENPSRQSEYSSTSDKPLVSSPRFLSPSGEVVGYLILLGVFMAQTYVSCVVLFLWYN